MHSHHYDSKLRYGRRHSLRMKKIRIASLLFPPLGLLLLWRSVEVSLPRKILGTFGIVLYSAIYSAGIVALLMLATGLEAEWVGPYIPILTWHKTVPNYDAVEANRRTQSKTPVGPLESSTEKVDWPGFRGAHRD